MVYSFVQNGTTFLSILAVNGLDVPSRSTAELHEKSRQKQHHLLYSNKEPNGYPKVLSNSKVTTGHKWAGDWHGRNATKSTRTMRKVTDSWVLYRAYNTTVEWSANLCVEISVQCAYISVGLERLHIISVYIFLWKYMVTCLSASESVSFTRSGNNKVTQCRPDPHHTERPTCSKDVDRYSQKKWQHAGETEKNIHGKKPTLFRTWIHDSWPGLASQSILTFVIVSYSLCWSATVHLL